MGLFFGADGKSGFFGVDPATFELSVDNVRALIHPEDWKHLQNAIKPAAPNTPSFQSEFRVCRPNGELRWCIGTAGARLHTTHTVLRISGVTLDLNERNDGQERPEPFARP